MTSGSWSNCLTDPQTKGGFGPHYSIERHLMTFNKNAFDAVTAQYIAHNYQGGETLQQVATRLAAKATDDGQLQFYMRHGEDGANVNATTFAESVQRLGFTI